MIVDADADGKLDLAVANSDSGSAGVLFWRRDLLAPRILEFATGRYPIALAAADIAGDSATDLAVANRSSHDVAVIRKLGDKLPDPAAVLTLGKHEPDYADRPDDVFDRYRHDRRHPDGEPRRRRRADRQPLREPVRVDDDPLVELGEPRRPGLTQLSLAVQRPDAVRCAARRLARGLLHVQRRRRGLGQRPSETSLGAIQTSAYGRWDARVAAPGETPAYRPLSSAEGRLRFRLSSPITLIHSHCTQDGQFDCEPPAGWSQYVLNSQSHDYGLDPSVVNPCPDDELRTCAPSSGRSRSVARSGRRRPVAAPSA